MLVKSWLVLWGREANEVLSSAQLIFRVIRTAWTSFHVSISTRDGKHGKVALFRLIEDEQLRGYVWLRLELHLSRICYERLRQATTVTSKFLASCLDPNQIAGLSVLWLQYKMSLSTLDSVRKPSTISFRPISESSSSSCHLIFFITGNPGLISYYKTFLSTLHQLLSDTSKIANSDVFHIYGQSLAGFEQNDNLPPRSSTPWSLEDQIEVLLQSLNDQSTPSGSRQGQPYDSIILIGHSVGTYIIMEILNRLRKANSPLKVNGAILLFPTVTHLAKSPSGVKFSSFFRIPGVPRGLSMLARTLLWPLPNSILQWLVGLVTGMPENGAETTTKFLTSSMGIWQAL